MLSNAVLRCKLMLKRVFIGCTERIRKCRYLSVIWTLFPVIVGLPFSGWVLAAPVPAMLKRIDIVYYIDFPWHKKYRVDIAKGCYRFFLHSGSAVLRCEENISLLRPLHIIKAWQRQQSKVGFFSLTINEFNIKNVHGYIKKIKSISLDTFPVHGQKTEFMTVTGRFIRHVNDVRKYHFRNRATGKISSIWSTPNHPFYVKNRGGFIPIEAISAEDEMVQRDGQVVKLIYPASHGTAGRVKPERSIVPVYNLEVFGKHTYFVGKDFILVHNTYKDGSRRKKTNCTRMSVKDRYNLILKRYIEEVEVMGACNIRYKTLEFRLKEEDREEFLLRYARSTGKDERSKISTAITEPLHKLGFRSERQKGKCLPNSKRDIVWKLRNKKKFVRLMGSAAGVEHLSPPLPLDSVSELPSSSAPGPSHFDIPFFPVPLDSGEPPFLPHFDFSVPLYSGEPPALSHFDPYPGGAPPFSLRAALLSSPP